MMLPHTLFFVYNIRMSVETIAGKPVTEDDIQWWVAEAEAGYDVELLRRRGRPAKGAGPGSVVPTRFDAPTLAALDARVSQEGLANRSEAIRAAVREWVRAV